MYLTALKIKEFSISRAAAGSCESRGSVLNKRTPFCFVFGAAGALRAHTEGSRGPAWSEAVWLGQVGSRDRTCASRKVQAPGIGYCSSQL